MKFAMCNELFEGWELSRVFEYAAGLGYHGVEIAPFTLADDCRSVSPGRRAELRRAAGDCGVEIVGLHWLLVKPEGLHLNSPDRSVRERTEAYLEALAEFCADLGGRVCVLGSPEQRSVVPPEPLQEAWRRAAEMLRRVAETASRCGVVLAFEPLSSELTNFVNTMAEGQLLVQAVDHPAFKLHLDVIALCAEGRPPAETIRLEGGTHLVHVHVNDPNKRGPGMGDLDFAPIAAALKTVGYDGYVSVEAFDAGPGPDQTARRSIETLRRHFCCSAK